VLGAAAIGRVAVAGFLRRRRPAVYAGIAESQLRSRARSAGAGLRTGAGTA